MINQTAETQPAGEVMRYSPDGVFPLHSIITHLLFGDGEVIAHIHPNKMDVQFFDGIKRLACGTIVNSDNDSDIHNSSPSDIRITASVRDKLEREIKRTEIHLAALKDILEGMMEEKPRRKFPDSVVSRIPLIEKALAKVRGTRTFSVKEVTAFARHIEPSVDRRLIYNCIKGYLQRGVAKGIFEQVSDTEYKRR